MHGSNNKDKYFDLINKKVKPILSSVIFTGYVDHNRLPDFYNVADVTVLPSIWEEPAGLTMIEALSCGSPLITTNSGGIGEYVDHKAVVIERDANIRVNLAEQILNVIENKYNYNEKDQVNYIKQNFSEKNYLEKFIDSIY